MSEQKIRKELVKYGKKLVEKGLVSGAGGNISARSGKFIYLSPGGFPLDKIKTSQSVKVELKTGKAKKSSLSPSCEMPMHLAGYRVKNDIGAFIHVHPPYALGLACAGITLKALFPDFVVLIGEKLPLISYFTPGSKKLAKAVGRALKNNQAVLLKNHGLVTVGKNLKEAYLRAEIVEEAAKIYFISKLSGKVRFLNAEEIGDIEREYKAKS